LEVVETRKFDGVKNIYTSKENGAMLIYSERSGTDERAVTLVMQDRSLIPAEA
jgi:hypothetical protein